MKQPDLFGYDKTVELDGKYTAKVTAPIYEPKGRQPHILELLDQSKAKELIREIEASTVTAEEKAFLVEAAKRHNTFYYSKIADYYAHASFEMQILMEKSALVIIDFKQAIELGFVKLTQDMASVDNFGVKTVALYARDYTFQAAKDLGYKYFMILEDDYGGFQWRFGKYSEPINGIEMHKLDEVLLLMLNYYKSIDALSIAFAQGGDFIGGKEGGIMGGKSPRLRKCMNSFLCSTDRPFKFRGTFNDDVNTYVTLGTVGKLFLTIPIIALKQEPTQVTSGGMSDIYLAYGTYTKSFYTVMLQPSSVVVAMMITKHQRLHHMIKWECTVPKIIHEKWRKSS